jgi:hypothetical protein
LSRDERVGVGCQRDAPEQPRIEVGEVMAVSENRNARGRRVDRPRPP